MMEIMIWPFSYKNITIMMMKNYIIFNSIENNQTTFLDANNTRTYKNIQGAHPIVKMIWQFWSVLIQTFIYHDTRFLRS